MRLIVISSSKTSIHEPKKVNEMLECGLETFHLRKPSMSTNEMRAYLESIPEHFHNRIIIHSHHKLASKYSLLGIHLTNIHRRRKFSTWMRIKMLKFSDPNLVVTTSFHKLGNLYNNHASYNYIFLGTIFDRLAGNYNAGYNEHSLRAAITRTPIPLIARGGITQELLPRCAEIGFAGASLASCIWDKPDPVKSWCAIQEFVTKNATITQ